MIEYQEYLRFRTQMKPKRRSVLAQIFKADAEMRKETNGCE